MAEAAKDQDQSMEEILQSIKRIIAEEGEPAAGGSDVLELTDMLADDGSISRAGNEGDVSGSIPTMSIEEIMAAPISSMPAPQQPAPAAEKPAPAPVPAAAPKPAPASEDSLLSDKTRAASLAALSALSEPAAAPATVPLSSPHFRSGATVEDLVVESLKPMLKDWLDSNLAALVERLVEKEIRKLSAR
jgi:cell pole-organizing protein PopZ